MGTIWAIHPGTKSTSTSTSYTLPSHLTTIARGAGFAAYEKERMIGKLEA